jgi:hypothetical protein
MVRAVFTATATVVVFMVLLFVAVSLTSSTEALERVRCEELSK